jgi:hypothetical protein
MQEQLGHSASSTNILKRPEHVLSFIRHALEDSDSSITEHQRLKATIPQRSTRGVSAADLRIVQELETTDEVYIDGEDSDDEDAPGLEDVQKGDEMTVTAINLLLSLLEGISLCIKHKNADTHNHLRSQPLTLRTNNIHSHRHLLITRAVIS